MVFAPQMDTQILGHIDQFPPTLLYEAGLRVRPSSYSAFNVESQARSAFLRDLVSLAGKAWFKHLTAYCAKNGAIWWAGLECVSKISMIFGPNPSFFSRSGKGLKATVVFSGTVRGYPFSKIALWLNMVKSKSAGNELEIYAENMQENFFRPGSTKAMNVIQPLVFIFCSSPCCRPLCSHVAADLSKSLEGSFMKKNKSKSFTYWNVGLIDRQCALIALCAGYYKDSSKKRQKCSDLWEGGRKPGWCMSSIIPIAKPL